MKKGISIGLLFLSACQSSGGGNVQLGTARPGGNCQEVGQVIGNADSRDNARQRAMADLRKEASHLSADYVRVLTVTAHGTAARGIAYRCR